MKTLLLALAATAITSAAQAATVYVDVYWNYHGTSLAATYTYERDFCNAAEYETVLHKSAIAHGQIQANNIQSVYETDWNGIRYLSYMYVDHNYGLGSLTHKIEKCDP